MSHRVGVLSLAIVACETSGAVSPADATTSPEVTPYAALLDKSKGELEPRLPPGTATEAGWVAYGESLGILYADDRAAEIKVVTPELDCLSAARWAGFVDAQPPNQDGARCRWANVGLGHSLAPDRIASYDLDTHELHVKVQLDPAS